jgi:integrase
VSDWEVDSGAGCPTNRISKPSPAPSIPANFLRSSTFSTRVQVSDIIANASEPYKTIFAVAWFTGLRAGEILALTVDDLSFDKRTIRVWKSADDNTREIRNQTKGKKAATLPMPTELETMLRDYLMRYEPSPDGLLFPAPRRKGFPRSRDNVVRHRLKPILKKLGIPRHNAGLHAFRHGLATELAEQSVQLTTMQAQMRHADITTTLRVYTHVIPQTHRDAMENLGIGQSLRGIITLRKTQAK